MTPPPNDNDLTDLWPQAVQLSYARRPLIRNWIDAASFLGTDGRTFLLGFAPEQKTVMESLSRPTNRSFIEGLLKELTSSEWTVKLSLVEGLPSTSPSATPAPTAPSTPEKTKPQDSLESFKNDPLIQEALEIFKGEIKSVGT